MKINKVQLHNYRNYKDFSVEFGSEATIIIGKNGTGKTNLIKAMILTISVGYKLIFALEKFKLFYATVSCTNIRLAALNPLQNGYLVLESIGTLPILEQSVPKSKRSNNQGYTIRSRIVLYARIVSNGTKLRFVR